MLYMLYNYQLSQSIINCPSTFRIDFQLTIVTPSPIALPNLSVHINFKKIFWGGAPSLDSEPLAHCLKPLRTQELICSSVLNPRSQIGSSLENVKANPCKKVLCLSNES